MPRPPLSVTIVTLNEEANIRQAIESVRWAEEVIVVDSGSTDKTLELAKTLGAKIIHNPWPGYGKQKNFAQSQASHDWVLNIDADEVVPEALRAEIERALEEVGAGRSAARGFLVPRKTFYLGKWIEHGGWYPNHLLRLADRRHSSWTEPSVHEELVTQGETRTLASDLHHYTFSSIQDQIVTNLRYSRLGYLELIKRGQGASVPLLLWKPVGKFIETYFLKLGFLDGLPGFIISVNAAHSIFLKYAYLIEAEIQNAAPGHRQ
jgi:glycosyltransferase involved in cell wall biosynthesis